MVRSNALTAVAAAVLLALPTANGESLYHKMSPVIQVDGKNYDRLIAKSNYTSVSILPSLNRSELILLDCRILCAVVRSLQESSTRV